MENEISEVMSLKVPDKPKKKSYYKKVKKRKTTEKKVDKRLKENKPKKVETIESLRLIKSAKREVSEAEITANCLNLRTQGKSIAKIAETLEISTGKVHKIISKSLSEAILLQGKDYAEQTLALELQRLDELYNKAFDALCADPLTLTGIKDCVKIVELRAKLIGLGSGKVDEKEENEDESVDTKNKKLENMLKKMVQDNKTGT